MTITDLYRVLFGREGTNKGTDIDMAEHGRVGGLSTGQPFKYVVPIEPSTGETLYRVDFNSANQSAFGTLETAELTPSFQTDFVYGLNTQIWATPTTSGTGATVDTDSTRLRIQSGTASGGYAYILGRRSIRYRAGQGTVVRFTPIFATGVASNIQLWGMGNIVNNLPYDGFFFGYNGTSFGIAHYIRGTPTWTAQTSWNGDKVDGTAGTTFTWDKTKGITVMIKYPYLGFGDTKFYVQNPAKGDWILVHTIRYGNTVNTTQLSNPSLRFIGFTLNSGNTSNLIMYCGSVGVFLSGIRSFVGNPKWGIDNSKGTITTEANILTLKNATTYNGTTNRGLIRITSMSFASTAPAGVGTIRIKSNATVGGTPSFTTINGTTADGGVTITSGNSITSYDTAGTTITNGTLVFNAMVCGGASAVIDLTPYDVFCAPGETLTFSGASTNSSTVGIAVSWTEDI